MAQPLTLVTVQDRKAIMSLCHSVKDKVQPTKPSQQKAHQGSGGGHVQLVPLLSEIVDEYESD